MSIKMEDVTVKFKKVTAVKHVSVEIPCGIYGLLGENGAGKTTLMRVLTTVIQPDSGSVAIDGLSYGAENEEGIRRKIGYLPQEIELYPSLTVRECLEYMGELSGMKKSELKQQIDYYLEKTSLTEHQRKKMRQLSGGMKRRVGLIQAMLNQPQFLIVDEPTTGLDPEERIRIRNLLVEFSKSRTVLFSTHVVADLAATCENLSIMKKGEFIYSGSMLELLNAAKGKVWICYATSEEQAKRIESEYPLVGKHLEEGGYEMKFLSENRPKFASEPAKITLEDAYMYVTHQDHIKTERTRGEYRGSIDQKRA